MGWGLGSLTKVCRYHQYGLSDMFTATDDQELVVRRPRKSARKVVSLLLPCVVIGAGCSRNACSYCHPNVSLQEIQHHTFRVPTLYVMPRMISIAFSRNVPDICFKYAVVSLCKYITNLLNKVILLIITCRLLANVRTSDYQRQAVGSFPGIAV